ncbi:MAG: LysR family transcriptional regulator [Pseudomonadota bacterium]
MQDLNDMLYFAEVVECGGFAAAARRLGLPKSKLSRRVAQLEERLGVRLLQRTTRKLSLTDVGALYLRHCSAMRDEARAAQEAVEHIQTEPRGTIRVACPLTLALSTIGPLIPRFMARHPQVRIDMRVSNRVVDLVEEGFDIALRVRPTLEDSASLVVKNFGRSRTLLVASPQQLQRQWQPTGSEQLAGLDTVAMSAVDGKASWVLHGPAGVTFTLVHQPRYCADDLATLHFAVLGGIGMCFMPEYMCENELRSGQMVEVLPGWSPTPGIFHAVYPTRRGMVPAVRAFLDFLGQTICAEGTPLLA